MLNEILLKNLIAHQRVLSYMFVVGEELEQRMQNPETLLIHQRVQHLFHIQVGNSGDLAGTSLLEFLRFVNSEGI
jgi:hypothetical protein